MASFDLQLKRGGRLELRVGTQAPILLSGVSGGLVAALPDGRTLAVRRTGGWGPATWWHVEATNRKLAVDDRTIGLRGDSGRWLTFRVDAGRPRVSALLLTASAPRGLVLLHRLAELHARLGVGQFPLGATLRDRLVDAPTYWTSGFWPGALWQAAALAPEDGLFARWALSATVAHFGHERAPTHDVGFMYGESSLAAWQALCSRGREQGSGMCWRLERSVLRAADELRSLAASNSRAGTIPTNPSGVQSDTIIDSMMNIGILPWASEVTGNRAYASLAERHAHTVARLLVRSDGSTTQAVNFVRASGRVVWTGTHQGLSDTSTWSRGEGWAVYGFALAAVQLHDRSLLRVAVRIANFVASHLPAGGIPRWDYRAPAGAPVDISAGVITAAGLFHLADACRTLPGICSSDRGRLAALAHRMLSAALGRARTEPPLGLLAPQVLNERGRGCWCDVGELVFGLTFALDAWRSDRTEARQRVRSLSG